MIFFSFTIFAQCLNKFCAWCEIHTSYINITLSFSKRYPLLICIKSIPRFAFIALLRHVRGILLHKIHLTWNVVRWAIAKTIWVVGAEISINFSIQIHYIAQNCERKKTRDFYLPKKMCIRLPAQFCSHIFVICLFVHEEKNKHQK